MPLMDLVREWEHSARRRFMDAKNEGGMEKRGLEDGAIIYQNCARELKKELLGDDTLGEDNSLLRELARRKMQDKWDLSGLTTKELEMLLSLAGKASLEKSS